jgi:hypothetical protein
LDVGAVQEIDMLEEAPLGEAEMFDGAVGTVLGVELVVGATRSEVPTAFIPVTLKS